MKRSVIALTSVVFLNSPVMAHHSLHRHHRHHRHYYHRYNHHSYHRHSFSKIRTASSSSHDLIVTRALSMGISKSVIEHVANKESGFRCSPPGHYNGPLQILASTAKAFGFHGGSLNNCGAGLHFGLLHLKMCVTRYGNNPYAVAACHARGF